LAIKGNATAVSDRGGYKSGVFAYEPPSPIRPTQSRPIFICRPDRSSPENHTGPGPISMRTGPLSGMRDMRAILTFQSEHPNLQGYGKTH